MKLVERVGSDCTGCGACVCICPPAALSIKENHHGFLAPYLDKRRCIRCGKCEKVCSILTVTPSPLDQLARPLVYAACNRNREIRLNSTSGGIFDLLARKIIDEGGKVFGAVFDKNFMVSQIPVEKYSEIEPLRFSKYVQSHTGQTFKDVSQALFERRKVLYVGTPCMIGGLRSLLGGQTKNLITCSFICGGVVSRKIWRKYIAYREQKTGSKISSVCFRDKYTGWKKSSFVITYENSFREIQPYWYLPAFYSGLSVVDACVGCKFRGVHQGADIMLADFWGIEEWGKLTENDDLGVSCVLIHTEKGKSFFASLTGEMYRKEAPLDIVIRRNRYLVEQKKPDPRKREYFFADINRLKFSTIMQKYKFQFNLLDRAIFKFRQACKAKFNCRRHKQ